MPWNTNEAGKRLRECIGHSKHPLPTTQEKTLHMDIMSWPTLKSDWLYSLQLKRSSIQPAKIRLGADYGTNHELFMPKLRLQLKKVGKTTRPFRYDLNQIPDDYTVEVRNRFKGLDLIDRVPEELWNKVHDIVQETGIKTIPMEKIINIFYINFCSLFSLLFSTAKFQVSYILWQASILMMYKSYWRK